MARYDEDLHENLFFQTLIRKHKSLFTEAGEKKWLVCVPRCDTVSRLKLGRTDFENHILCPLPGSDSDSKFISCNNKHVIVDGDVMKAGQGYKEARKVKILFDECFFNSREESYQVFCLEQPLEGAMSEDVMVSLKNLEDCIKFLWGETGGEKVRKSIDKLVDMVQIDGTMRSLLDAALAVYTRAVQEVFKIRKFQAVMQKNYCKLAVETYVMANLHKKIFKEVCFLVAGKDAQLNKITRNLSDTNPQSLGIRPQYRLVLKDARAVLSQLNQFTTPLEKLYCFSHTVGRLKGAWQGEGQGGEVLTADELLPILVYLVIVTDIPNWTGNLSFISRFHFSNVTYEEFTYYLTSFEAAVEYVRSEHVQLHGNSSSLSLTRAKVDRMRSNSSSLLEDAEVYFKLMADGDTEGVRELLDKALQEKANLKSLLCHPLCDCSKCSHLLNKQRDDSGRVSVHLRDQDGRTGLHYAALSGLNAIMQLLIERGAITMATDHNSSTPLHLSCLKGHQKCTLLLLSRRECSINALDNNGNTPLHQACSNGHEECVKALLFHTASCDVNATNEQGDTPLHNAARWGYASIVSELISMGANPHLQNKRREVPLQCAQNRKVQDLLSKVDAGAGSQDNRVGGAGQSGMGGGGVVGGVGGARGVVSGDGDGVTSSVKSRRMSRRLSGKDMGHESDRQLKKLFKAITEGDTHLVRYLFGWDDPTSTAVPLGDLCHPLCQCDRCSRLRKTTSTAVLSVNCSDSSGLSPLHKASLTGHRVLVEMLLTHGALINLATHETNMTPLHLACQYNQKDVVLLLIEHNSILDPRDVSGNTPLHCACSNGHMETAALLLMHGADVSLANLRGDTPLHNAARWNHPMLVNELLLYGASYTATNNKDATPGDLTSDDQVLDLIRKAMSGRLAVGSYSPLTQSFNKVEHRKFSNQRDKNSISDSQGGSSLERSDGHAQSVPSGRTASLGSSGSKSSSFEYVQAPAPEPEGVGTDSIRGVAGDVAVVRDVEVESYEVIESSEHEMKVARSGDGAEGGGVLWTDEEEEEEGEGTEREEGGALSLEEEHRTLSGQDNPQSPAAHGVNMATGTEQVEVGGNERHSRGSTSDGGVGDLVANSITGRPVSMGDKKLYNLLHAIEAFDRSTLNRRFRSKDKKVPITSVDFSSSPPSREDDVATPTTEASLPTSPSQLTPSLPSSPLTSDHTHSASFSSTRSSSPGRHVSLHSSIALHTSVTSSLSPNHSLPPAQEYFSPMADEEELHTAGLGVGGQSPSEGSGF